MDGNAKRPHPKAVGDQTTAMVLARLVQAGKMVLLPFGENQRYDLVVDEGDRVVRIQCKTGRLRNGAIRFNACSTTYHNSRSRPDVRPYRRDYRGTADVFGVYCPETDSVYLVPVEVVGRREASLRVSPTINNQSKRVRWAGEFEVSAPG
jgi:hypothetical protein